MAADDRCFAVLFLSLYEKLDKMDHQNHKQCRALQGHLQKTREWQASIREGNYPHGLPLHLTGPSGIIDPDPLLSSHQGDEADHNQEPKPCHVELDWLQPALSKLSSLYLSAHSWSPTVLLACGFFKGMAFIILISVFATSSTCFLACNDCLQMFLKEWNEKKKY